MIQVVDAMGQEKKPLAARGAKGKAKAPQFSPEVMQALPQPRGYKILVAIPKAEEKTEAGIFKAQETMRVEEIATVTGYVLLMGPDCYADQRKFPSGAYCEPGDFVVFRAFTGTRITIFGQEFRLINDDSVEAVVDDPRGIRRAG